MNQPTYRARIWNLLRTAHGIGRAGVSVAVLATVLGVAPEGVLAAVLPDMMETAPGHDAPAIYCEPTGDGPTLAPRYFPTGEGGQ